ncbi:MAG: tyrosine/phenylalanine carboxypeptidase domain-containing protein [Kofleriaceae bacterium]
MTVAQTLTDLGGSFEFLLAVTPTNLDAAWHEFRTAGHRRAPGFEYAPLEVDPAKLCDALATLALTEPLHVAKREELRHQLAMLSHRDSPEFLAASLAHYGAVDPGLLASAHEILAAPVSPRATDGERCDASAFCSLAETELEAYRRQLPTLTTQILMRDDLSSLCVSRGNLLIPRQLDVARDRATALLHHEVGTHVVTYVNGKSQPLQMLGVGLPGYEALQEGLAMLAEYFAGGLDQDRLRLVAARVVAVHRLVEGGRFEAVYEELVALGFSPRIAFGIVTRVFRGGGLTKDAIYLRGVVQLLAALAAGIALATLLVGKLALEHVPMIEAMLHDGVLHPAPLRARWLDLPGADLRLARLRRGLRPLDLLEGVS